MMEIYPAIDLMNGHCVRLTKGDFAACKTYGASPLDVARTYEEAGATWLHLVDLDGAHDTHNRQTGIIADLVKNTRLNVQTGGGIRTPDDVCRLLDLGARRIILGSLSVKEPAMVSKILETYGKDKIVLALDVLGDRKKGFYVATNGWQETSRITIDSLLERYNGTIRHVLCTDISCDGKLEGPNTELYENLAKRWPAIRFQASGGVATLQDIENLKTTGVPGIVIGKALYERRFTLREALERAV